MTNKTITLELKSTTYDLAIAEMDNINAELTSYNSEHQIQTLEEYLIDVIKNIASHKLERDAAVTIDMETL